MADSEGPSKAAPSNSWLGLAESNTPSVLWELQKVDSSLQELRWNRENLSQRQELQSTTAGARALTAELEESEAALDELRVREGNSLKQAESLNKRISALSSRLYGPVAAGARDLVAIDHELETSRTQLNAIEEETLSLMEAMEEVGSQYTNLEVRLEGMGQSIRILEEELRERESEIDQGALPLLHRRAEIASAIAPATLSKYERLRARLGGVAVAQLVDKSCGGCHLELAATELDHLRHAPPSALPACESCGRLLVRL